MVFHCNSLSCIRSYISPILIAAEKGWMMIDRIQEWQNGAIRFDMEGRLPESGLWDTLDALTPANLDKVEDFYEKNKTRSSNP